MMKFTWISVLFGFFAMCSCRSIETMEISTDIDSGKSEAPLYSTNKIAFSAYLSETKTEIGIAQHIKFDKVLLNDGDGYEPALGTFRAPVSGVYMFTFVVSAQRQSEIKATLVLDGKPQMGAVAEGVNFVHDNQGTNTVILHVCKNKSVWIEAVSGSKVEGNNKKSRYTSFSGFLLYEKR